MDRNSAATARLVTLAVWIFLAVTLSADEESLELKRDVAKLGWIRPGKDGTHFVRDGSGIRFVVWGVNYDHDRDGRLLEDYWDKEWPTVVEDFQVTAPEILGYANPVTSRGVAVEFDKSRR